MRPFGFSAVLGLALCVPCAAQVGEDPLALVRSWYAQFLDREPDIVGITAWTTELRSGKPPQQVLASLLASDEYYVRAGSSPEGLVRALFLDLTSKEPPPRELQELAQLARSQPREQVALAVLQRFEQAWRLPANVTDRDYLVGIQERARVLNQELEHFQEDIIAELDGRRERDLYRLVDAALAQLRQFRRSLRAGATREQIYADFGQMDRRLHELDEAVPARAGDHRSLLRSLARVQRADQQLHYALSQGDAGEQRGQEVLPRLVRALAMEGRELQRTARYVLAESGRNAGLVQSSEAFVDVAERLQKSLHEKLDRERLRREFTDLDKTWGRVARDMNQLPGAESGYLRARAQRVDALQEQLHQQLGLRTERARFILQLERPRP